MNEIDKIALLYVRDKQLLITRSTGKSVYYIPGGKRENDETDEQTLVREVLEELSVEILTDTIKYYGTFQAQAHGKENGVLVKMTCYIADFFGALCANSEIEEIAWFGYSDIEKVSAVDKIIYEELRKKHLII